MRLIHPKTIQLTSLALGAALASSCARSGIDSLPQYPRADTMSSHGLRFSPFYSFPGGTGGGNPHAGLTRGKDGLLLGTTSGSAKYKNAGSVFSINGAGRGHVLSSFADGLGPGSSLVNVNGTLYGTTVGGGAYGGGTVFSINAAGKTAILHSFGKGSDGKSPLAALTPGHGLLYGTTQFGGSIAGCTDSSSHKQHCGTVFSISPSGTERVLHSFGTLPDGAVPVAGFADVKGTLVGTTEYGGEYDEGTLFSIEPNDSAEKVLHSFGNGLDGRYPVAAVIDVQGTLYGIANEGGGYGGGVVFRIDPDGTNEAVLHSFGSGVDGSAPYASLTYLGGKFFSTTLVGGKMGQGTVYRVDLDGKNEHVLHDFGAGQDGSWPAATLLNVRGTLYGTTVFGGASNAGMIFALTP